MSYRSEDERKLLESFLVYLETKERLIHFGDEDRENLIAEFMKKREVR